MTSVSILHLYPIVALVFLPYIVLGLMARSRFDAVRKGLIPLGFFKTYQRKDVVLPDTVELPARNYTNLFELPVLFFALMPLLFIFQKADYISLAMTWIFVATRYGHTWVHLGRNKIFWRMRIFTFGGLMLLAMWIRFFLQEVI
jgi:hypothetical protein